MNILKLIGIEVENDRKVERISKSNIVILDDRRISHTVESKKNRRKLPRSKS
jgi:hypothetical protein